MRARCRNSTDHDFANYGGRGILVCARWDNFVNFLADMGLRPAGRSLERKDVNGNYEPDNCRWATQKEQTNNTRRNHRLEFQGVTQNIAQWASAHGWSRSVIDNRLRMGWSLERTLTEPVNWYRKPWRANRTTYG